MRKKIKLLLADFGDELLGLEGEGKWLFQKELDIKVNRRGNSPVIEIDESLKLGMDDEISKAKSNEYISDQEVSRLLKNLKKIKNNEEFKKKWNQIESKWGKYFANKDMVYFGRQVIISLKFFYRDRIFRSYYRKEFELKRSKEFISERKLNELKKIRESSYERKKKELKKISDFLEQFKINAVLNGKPLVYLPCKMKFSEDNAGRTIWSHDIPLSMSSKKFREIVIRKYSILKKVMLSTDRTILVERAGWGEKSGKRSYMDERDEKIFKRYIELKEEGLIDFDIFPIIHEELELDEQMKTWESVKPVVLRHKKTKGKK